MLRESSGQPGNHELPMKSKLILLTKAILILAIRLLPTIVQADEFADKLEQLESQVVAQVGRDVLLNAYQELLDKYPQHPGRAKAMLQVANLWQIDVPNKKVAHDREKELAWLKRSRSETKVGDALWLETGFRIAGCLEWSKPGEAKKVLSGILDHANNFITSAKAYYELQTMACREKDYAEAERICRMLQEWMSDQTRQPEAMFQKGQFFEVIQASASSMMIAWAEMDAPTEVRRKKIDGLLVVFPRQYMERAHERAIEHLKRLPVIDQETFERLKKLEAEEK